MSAITIGIQTIMPKTGTSPQQTPPEPANDRGGSDASTTISQAPPPPGMGKLIDRTV